MKKENQKKKKIFVVGFEDNISYKKITFHNKKEAKDYLKMCKYFFKIVTFEYMKKGEWHFETHFR